MLARSSMHRAGAATDCAAVVLHLLDFHAALPRCDTAIQAGLAATAVAGEDLDAIQRSDDARLHAAFIEGLAPLQGAIALHQHCFQAGQIEAAQTVARHVIAKAAITADPVLQGGLGQIRLQLLKTEAAGRQSCGRRPERPTAGRCPESAANPANRRTANRRRRHGNRRPC